MPEIDALQIKLLRQASPEQKLALVAQMNATVKTLALAGLHSRYPDASPQIIHRHLADLILGETLAQQIYGPAPYAR